MKKITFLLVLAVLAGTVNVVAQDIKTLNKNLKAAKSAQQKADAMIALGRWHFDHYGHRDFPHSADSTWYYAETSEKLCIAKNLKPQLGYTYNLISFVYADNMQQDKASAYAEKAIKIFEKTTDKQGLSKAYNRLLTAETQKQTVRKDLLTIAEKAVKIATEAGDNELKSYLLEKTGYYYSRIGQYDKTTEYLEKAIIACKNSGNTAALKTFYTNIAGFYILTGSNEKALHYNHEAVAVLNKLKKYDSDDSLIFGTLADNYSSLGYINEAILYATKAWEIANKYNNRDYEALSEKSLIDMLCIKKRRTEAQFHYKNLESYLNSLDPFVKASSTDCLLQHGLYLGYPERAKKYADMAISYINTENPIREIRRNLAKTLATYFLEVKDYTKARQYGLLYTGIVEKNRSISHLQEAYLQLFKIDSSAGNYPEAMRNYSISMQYKDSIMTEKRVKEIARIETLYKTREKEKDNELLKKQARLKEAQLDKTTLEKNLSLLGIALLVLTVILVYRGYYVNRKTKKQISIKNVMLQNLLNEKEWLLKEIHHRVKNNLQIVMSLLGAQSHFLDDSGAKEAIKNSQHRIHSMSLIHKKLYQSDNIVTINVELYFKELVEYYKLAFDTRERIRFEVDVAPLELESAQAVPMGLILNEAVNNALKHAFPDEATGLIKLSLKSEGDTITFKVQDNGVGMPDTETRFNSLGLNLISGFSRELNAQLQIDGTNGVAITVTFKYSKPAVA